MLRVLSKFSIPNVLLSIEFPVSNLQYKLHKMTMLRKIIDCESLGNSQENFYGGVYVSKIASLQCNNYKSIISRLHHRFFSEFVPKISCLRKKSMVYQRFSNFNKNWAHRSPFQRSAEKSDKGIGKSPSRKFFSSKYVGLEETDSTIECSVHVFCKTALLKISENF